MNERAQARCSVTMTIEVIPDDVWGDDCSIAQVRKQGIDSARSMIEKMFRDNRRFSLLRIDKADVVTFQEPTEAKS